MKLGALDYITKPFDMDELKLVVRNALERKDLIEENRDLRSQSEASLRLTRQRYGRLDDAVNLAAGRMDPVLQQLKDYVLYLKHNLNAQAVGSLRIEADKIEAQVDQLIRDIQTSVGEAEEFLKTFERP
jgi:DNA-binding response OmpR family regulator